MELKLNHGSRPPLFLNLFLFFILFHPSTAICVIRNGTLFGLYLTKTKTLSSSSVSVPPKQSPQPSTQVSAPSQAPTPSPSQSLLTISVTPSPDNSQPNDNRFSRSSTMPLPVQPLTTTPPELKKLCDNTDYPSLCVASLTPFVDGKVEPISLLGLAIKATKLHVKNALAMASKLAAAPGASEGDVMSLESCKEIYDDAMYNLESANEAVGSRDIGTVNSMMSAVVTDSENCEDSFDGESPLFKYDDKLRKMASNCLAIASLIN
ncbi:pectinesterase inhibitor 4 [Humulus lupulus]|uniref:pectinesterase inhibitor 4 n=1 Tax=Humulus lupulus TaxID=3486 RepID=UPI002B40D5AC|nr:pectinesterase inhibitor 4 [Humulus lupulus]